MKQRKNQREAAGARTANLVFQPDDGRPVALLYGEEAARVMESKPTRLPDLVLQSPHEANHLFHEDWTRVPGSSRDPELWEKELRLRDSRNRLIRDYLVDGRSVFYKSSGNSM